MNLLFADKLFGNNIAFMNSDFTVEELEEISTVMEFEKGVNSSKCRLGLGDTVLEDKILQQFTKAFKMYVNHNFESEIWSNFDFYQDLSVNVYENGTAAVIHSHNEAFVSLCLYTSEIPVELTKSFCGGLLAPKFRAGQLGLFNPEGSSLFDRYSKNESNLTKLYLPQMGQIIVFEGRMPHFTVGGLSKTRHCLASFVFAKPKTSIKMEI